VFERMNYEKREDDSNVRDSRGELVSSEAVEPWGQHLPLFDLDVPHQYVPSSTPGNGHLYINVPCSWRQYKKVLIAMRDAGMLNHGWVERALQDKRSYLRRVGAIKETASPEAYVERMEAAGQSNADLMDINAMLDYLAKEPAKRVVTKTKMSSYDPYWT